MSIYVVAITAMGARRMDVTFIGKTGTFLQMVAFPMFLIASDTTLSSDARDVCSAIAWAFGLPGLVCGYIAFAGYLREGPGALRDGRTATASAVRGADSAVVGEPSDRPTGAR
jgi:phosphatidylglycerophosphate synthase